MLPTQLLQFAAAAWQGPALCPFQGIYIAQSAATLAAPAAPAGAAPASVLEVRRRLDRTQSVLFDARQDLHAMRDENPRRPARFTRIRAAILRLWQARASYKAAAEAFHASPAGEQLQHLIDITNALPDLRELVPALRELFPTPTYQVGCGGAHTWLHRTTDDQRLALIC